MNSPEIQCVAVISGKLPKAASARRRIRATRFFCVGIVALFLLSWSAWRDEGSTLPQVLTLLGLVLATVGALGRLWCSSYIAGNKNALFGPYYLLRHALGATALVFAAVTAAILGWEPCCKGLRLLRAEVPGP